MKKVIAIILTTLVLGCSGKGIITLEGYEHGVVICGEAMVINAGHYNDPQVKELVALAHTECAKLTEKN